MGPALRHDARSGGQKVRVTVLTRWQDGTDKARRVFQADSLPTTPQGVLIVHETNGTIWGFSPLSWSEFKVTFEPADA